MHVTSALFWNKVLFKKIHYALPHNAAYFQLTRKGRKEQHMHQSQDFKNANERLRDWIEFYKSLWWDEHKVVSSN